jgi:hypothetical protein
MAKLIETVDYLRCKNAGPFALTFDIFCGNHEAYEKVKASKNFSPKLFVKLYKVPEESVAYYYLPKLNIVKVSIPRPQVQGNRFERDQHQCQQAILLYDAEL